jgi:hypothetical protein
MGSQIPTPVTDHLLLLAVVVRAELHSMDVGNSQHTIYDITMPMGAAIHWICSAARKIACERALYRSKEDASYARSRQSNAGLPVGRPKTGAAVQRQSTSLFLRQGRARGCCCGPRLWAFELNDDLRVRRSPTTKRSRALDSHSSHTANSWLVLSHLSCAAVPSTCKLCLHKTCEELRVSQLNEHTAPNPLPSPLPPLPHCTHWASTSCSLGIDG